MLDIKELLLFSVFIPILHIFHFFFRTGVEPLEVTACSMFLTEANWSADLYLQV